MLVFLDGHFVGRDQAKISVWDGGYLYGDGIFTTLRLYNGKAIDAAAHYQRLLHQAHLLDLPFNLSADNFTATLEALAQANGLSGGDSRARITLSRSGDPENPLPLDHLDKIPATVLMTVGPLPHLLPQWQNNGIPVITLDASYARGNLPHLKTTNALPMLVALRQAHARGCPEALVFHEDGQLLEGIISNVFIVHHGKLLTPAHSGSFLPGRTRERVISFAKELGLPLEECTLHREHIASAQEVFMTNSVREIVPVVVVDGEPVGVQSPGPITRQLQEHYRREIQNLPEVV